MTQGTEYTDGNGSSSDILPGGPSPAALAALHERIEGAAAVDGLLDVAYRFVDTSIGQLLVAVTPAGLLRIAFEREDYDDVLESLATSVGPRILRSPRRTAEVARQLDEYFAGARRHFDVDLDLRLVGGFRREVVRRLREITYGETATYAEVALSAGSPRAARAVGSACSHNPIPIVVPCHRVVRSDRSVGQYLAGSEVKAELLAMERRVAGGGRARAFARS